MRSIINFETGRSEQEACTLVFETREKKNVKADGLVLTRLKYFIWQFPDLEIVEGGEQNYMVWGSDGVCVIKDRRLKWNYLEIQI